MDAVDDTESVVGYPMLIVKNILGIFEA